MTMHFAFDLISDLHVESWDNFDWTGQPTAPYCVVAGDVARDRTRLVEILTHLGECYHGGVFYIDGNDEHREHYEDLGESYRDLQEQITQIPNIVYMQDNVVVVNGVALLATNGWWTYDFDPELDFEQSVSWFQDYAQTSNSVATSINGMAYNDAAYMINSVHKLQTHQEVSAIVMISHTVPEPWIVEHDIDLVGHWRYNGLGNSYIGRAFKEDTENKIRAWCFGHYHKSVDQVRNGIRYVNNPRGRGDTPWCQTAYYPKRIEIEY
jgi:predicted phosphodiesterase